MIVTLLQRKQLDFLTPPYSCHVHASFTDRRLLTKQISTAFETSIGPLASEPGVPPVLSLRTIKSDVVVGIGAEDAERLDREEVSCDGHSFHPNFLSLAWAYWRTRY